MNLDKRKSLFEEVQLIIRNAREQAYRQSNSLLLEMYWQIGRLIVEDEQQGKAKAAYGKAVLKNLSRNLTLEFGKGFDERNLNNMRAFFLAFPIWYAVRTELSWTHYRLISRIEDEPLRYAYVIEAATAGWDTRVLERNIKTQYLSRTLRLPSQETLIQQSFIRDPYIFEFLSIPQPADLNENELETALINHL